MADDPFAALRLEYLEGARSRLAALRNLSAAAAGDGAALAELRKLAHNLRGSGGFYGFADITAAAAQLEDLTLTALAGERAASGEITRAAAALAAAIGEARLP